ncbi:hypothetical protein MANES_17G121232v8 [Manihot esculenta]|uniref:Uncharacterized protein n=1 Tax=Manihot esculenta TaxID=3983 RepID=A0ACB7G5N7_MANES|nr:hypothetical protein MANES_17G121232v8 [Manihot esculenta]
MDQAVVLNNVLECFCKSFGKKMNRSKIRIFFSNNVNHKLRKDISGTHGVQMTDDLGKYLDVALLHSRVTKRNLQYVLEKMKKKLSSRKLVNSRWQAKLS